MALFNRIFQFQFIPLFNNWFDKDHDFPDPVCGILVEVGFVFDYLCGP